MEIENIQHDDIGTCDWCKSDKVSRAYIYDNIDFYYSKQSVKICTKCFELLKKSNDVFFCSGRKVYFRKSCTSYVSIQSKYYCVDYYYNELTEINKLKENEEWNENINNIIKLT